MISARFFVVDGRERLAVQPLEPRVPRIRLPVRLVERRGLEDARRRLEQVVASPPVVGRERPLEVLVAVDRAAVDVSDRDVDAAGLRVLGEDRRALDHPRVRRARDELDLQVLLAGLAQERPCLLGVVAALRELVARVRRVERRVDVVRDAPEPREALLHDLGSVDEQAERPPHAHVVERWRREIHAERRPRARLGRVDAESAPPSDDRDLCERHVRHGLDLPGEERVHLRRVGREVDDPHLVEVRLARRSSSSRS